MPGGNTCLLIRIKGRTCEYGLGNFWIENSVVQLTLLSAKFGYNGLVPKHTSGIFST